MNLWTLGAVVFALSIPAIPNTVTPAHADALPALSAKDKHQADDEAKQGAAIAADLAKTTKFVTDKAKVDRVNAIGQKLAAIANSTVIPESADKDAQFGNDRVYPFTWHFYIINDKDVNAFSLPGGYVYINSGLLDFVRSDDELAGVMAHEITHAAHHHVAMLSHEQSKMNTQMALGLIAAILAHLNSQDIANLSEGAQYTQMGIMNNKFSESAERDADHGGTIIMQKAGYNPVAMLTFMQRLADMEKRSPAIELGILRDHPYTQERVGLIQKHLASMGVTITAQTVRQVSGAPRVSVTTANGVSDLAYAGQKVATIADPAGTRGTAAAALFNSLLDSGLQLYQVKAEDDAVIAADKTVLTITPADVALHPGTTARSLAEAAGNALRTGLYAQSFTANSTSY